MCCLFGILDYGNSLSERQKKKLLSVLSVACEARGTDATGIAYRTGNRLCVYKRPLPAHRLHFRVPAETRYIMGHTRMTTQGSEKHNFNNHPFVGQAGGMSFALAHNGVLRNDKTLRETEQLPATRIETDSYIAVQLIEQYGSLSFDALRHTAELVRGSFNFTVLDGADHLYIVKGSNPFCLYHWRKHGLYLYASTEEILQTALRKLPFSLGRPEKIALKEGDILRIDPDGCRSMEQFEPQYYYGMPFPYTRKFLTIPERELLTFAILAAQGGCEPQVKAHVGGNAAVGNSKETLLAALTVCLPYIGFPRTLNALGCVNEVLPEKA